MMYNRAECVGPAARSARGARSRPSASGTCKNRGKTMSSRDDILARVRKNQPAPQPLPEVPTFDAAASTTPLERFKARCDPHGRQSSSILPTDSLDKLDQAAVSGCEGGVLRRRRSRRQPPARSREDTG